MKVLKQILFAFAVMICVSVTASAQKDGDDRKNTPKKEKPPVIVVPDNKKPKDNDKPKDRDKDKRKPESAYLKSSEDTTTFA
jgi:hypothetical protein